MKIAYVCADFGIPVRGHKGASVHVRELVNALSAAGHDVRVFTPHEGEGHAVAAPVERVAPAGLPDTCARLVRRVPRRHARLDKEARELAYNVTLYRRLRRECAAWRPDVVYERYSLYNLAGLALARRLGAPHLLEVNAPLRLERARTKGLALRAVAAWVERRLFGASDAVLTVSTPLERYVLEHGGRGSHTRVVPNAVDTARFQPHGGGAEARVRLGLPADAPVIGFAGSLKPWHGTDTLLDAFAQVHQTVPSARLLIVGEGPEERALRARTARLGLEDVVVFTGKVAHDRVPDCLAAMDVAAAPYRDVPAFYFSPLKLYEYMAAGRAVVASDVGEIDTLVRDGETGLLCPPGDAPALAACLLRLIDDADLRARLGAAARAHVERFTWEANVAVVMRLAGDARARGPRKVAAAGRNRS